MNMEIEELRKQCKRFFWCESIPVFQELFDIYVKFFFMAVIHHNYD